MAEFLVWLIAFLGAVAGGVFGRLWGHAEGRRAGKREAYTDALEDTNKRIARGRAAVRDGRGRAAAERLRDNDDRW